MKLLVVQLAGPDPLDRSSREAEFPIVGSQVVRVQVEWMAGGMRYTREWVLGDALSARVQRVNPVARIEPA